MKNLWAFVAVSSSVTRAACGGGEVVVQASVERADGTVAALPDLVVRALPYDREALFAELEQAYGTPEPAIPDSTMALRDEIAKAQEEWSNAETIWSAARDSAIVLSNKMKSMNRASAQYTLAYRDFNAQEAVVQRTEQASKSAFARFEELMGQYRDQALTIRQAREQWGNEAFATVDSVIESRMLASGLQ